MGPGVGRAPATIAGEAAVGEGPLGLVPGVRAGEPTAFVPAWRPSSEESAPDRHASSATVSTRIRASSRLNPERGARRCLGGGRLRGACSVVTGGRGVRRSGRGPCRPSCYGKNGRRRPRTPASRVAPAEENTGVRIELVRGDITEQPVDAIVNAANSTLL